MHQSSLPPLMLSLPEQYPKELSSGLHSVGTGEKAIIYLGRYLYRGVIQEKDILVCENRQVTFRYQNGRTKKMEIKTVSGVAWRFYA